MEKDKRIKSSDKAENSASESGRILERRARKGGAQTERDSARIAPRRPLSVEAFQETLTKYCRRFQKDDREFCVASLSILEYKHSSDTEREHLDKAVVNVLLRFLRSEDRICFIEPAHYLILTPYTSLTDANIALQRVAEQISHSRIRVKTKFMQPSAFFKVVSSGSRTSHDKGETVIDAESIYNSIGYTFDGKGRLCHVDDQVDSQDEPLFRGNLDDWLERYTIDKNAAGKLKTAKAGNEVVEKHLQESIEKSQSKKSSQRAGTVDHMHDRWNHGALVEFRALSVLTLSNGGHATISSATSGNLLRRLRVLQNLDHPGLSKLTDFYAKRDGTLFLVNSQPDGTELSAIERAGKKAPSLTTEKLLSWMQQILSAMIAMQSLVPPVVPSNFGEIKVFCSENGGKDGGRIVLSNYDIDYLLNAGISTGESNESPGGGNEGLMAGLVEFILQLDAKRKKNPGEDKSLSAFLTGLDANALSTPYKLRAQLKNFAEKHHA